MHVGVRLSGHRLAGYEGGEVRVIFHEVHMPVSDGSHGARRAFMVLARESALESRACMTGSRGAACSKGKGPPPLARTI